MKYSLIILIIFLSACTAGTSVSTNSGIPTENILESEVYEWEIKTIRAYPLLRDPLQELFPAVAERGRTQIVIEFDDLVEGNENYFARLIHCNADWTKSRLSPLQYLDNYNEFMIDDFELSTSTIVPYVHYKFRVPQVKIPGNYIVEVYRNSPDEVVFRQRIAYYDNLVKIRSENFNAGFNINRLNQRINFTLDYQDYDLVDPLERVTVVIRQNERWDKSIFGLKPTFVRQELKELEYEYFDERNNFTAGNEYRAFDLRSILNAGANVQQVNNEDTLKAVLMVDQPRTYLAYSQDRDLNGNYVVLNYDPGSNDFGGDYVNVIFTLKTGRKYLGDVYIHGALTNWNTEPYNKMRYVPQLNAYQGKLLLKQGWYNYEYLLKGDTVGTNFIEGDHFQTENSYDVLVYYNSINLSADILIGYERWFINPQF